MAGPDSGSPLPGQEAPTSSVPGAPHPGAFHRVADPTQARLLTDPRSKAFFKPFLARERSVAEAARLLGCPLNTMIYRVGTFVRAGLLRVVREDKRPGRAVRVYRSVHDAYFVPFALTPYATLEERLEVQAAPIFANLIQAYAAALRRSDRYGHHLFVGGDGAVWTTDLLPDLDPGGQPTVYSDATPCLRLEDARVLGHDLQTLFSRGLTSQAGRPGRGATS